MKKTEDTETRTPDQLQEIRVQRVFVKKTNFVMVISFITLWPPIGGRVEDLVSAGSHTDSPSELKLQAT
jgi:hypothetical protein